MQQRRQFIQTASALIAGSVAIRPLRANAFTVRENALKGNVKHSVCRWTFDHLSLDDLCKLVQQIGFNAIDLVGPKDWHTLQQYGIDSSMCNGAELNLVDGFNDPQFHSALVKNYSELIPLVAKNGYKNLILFSGNRRGMDDETGLKNCVAGIQKILPLAEKHGVVLQMELFNSKVNHPDYMCDNTTWGIALCKALQSENFKLLYDIYHMQINEGNIIATIQQNHQYFGHYHTAGVPGRHELTPEQELNYPAIMKAIVATGYKGYVAHEFLNTGKTNEQKAANLMQAVQVCDV
jgi:hydroxypyruvate isomerase